MGSNVTKEVAPNKIKSGSRLTNQEYFIKKVAPQAIKSRRFDVESGSHVNKMTPMSLKMTGLEERI